MNLIEKILYWLQGTMPLPLMFGPFHIVSILLVLSMTVLIAIRYRHSDEKTLKRVLLTMGIICLSFETYKQLIYSFHYDPALDQVSWSYQWYAFPFHFCSIPMYLAPLAAVLKPGKVRQAIFNFLGTFGLFGGLAVLIYAEPVYITMIGINIQTMVHHGSQVVLGVYLIASGRVQLKYKAMLGASIVFIIPVLMSIVINVIFYQIRGVSAGQFNMFWISPYWQTELPILNGIQPLVPYPIFVLIYISGFMFIAMIVLSITMLLSKIKFVPRSVKKPAF